MAHGAVVPRITPFTRDEEARLARFAADPSDPGRRADARRELVERHMPVVLAVIRRHRLDGRGLPLDDLIQEGCRGLLRAADGFDPGRGLRFQTYAQHWIRQAVARAIWEQVPLVAVPCYLGGKGAARRVPASPAAREKRAANLRRADAALSALVCPIGAQSRDHDGANDRDRSVRMHFADPPSEAPPPDRDLSDADERAFVRSLVARLPERERAVLVLRYGLDGGGERSRPVIAAALGVTRWIVCQAEADALEALRQFAGVPESA